MIDIADSTAAKEKHFWVAQFAALFEMAHIFVGGVADTERFKVVGDMLMFWWIEGKSQQVPDPDKLLASLEEMVGVKASVVRFSNALDITFHKETNDIYGQEIDLAARLLSHAEKGEILLNAPFRQKLTVFQNRLQGPWTFRFKGFSTPVETFKLVQRRS